MSSTFLLKYRFDDGPPVYITTNLVEYIDDHKFAREFAMDKWFNSDANYNALNAYVITEIEFNSYGTLNYLELSEWMKNEPKQFEN